MHDRRVQPGLDALVQEHRVQRLAGGRVQAEGDVRQAQRGLHLRVAALELADGLDGLQAVAAGLLLAGADREGQAVHEDVGPPACPSSPVRSSISRLGDRDLLLGGAGLALLVDRQGDDAGAVLGDQAA